MTLSPTDVVGRCRKLGLECDSVPTDAISSVVAALSCFPMYMVANVDAWTSDRQFRVPLVDLPGSEHIRESFVLGTQEGKLNIDHKHRRLLGTLVANTKPCDLVIYEFALETLKLALDSFTPRLAEQVRVGVARTIVAVAKASGEGLGGTGPKISPQERDCIQRINEYLALSAAEPARSVLAEVLS